MAKSVLRYTIHTSLAKTLYNEVLSRVVKYYFSFGRTAPWGTTNEVPPDAVDTDIAEFDARKNTVFMREISPNDVCLVIDRYNWVANNAYDMYDYYSESYPSTTGATSLDTAYFYVVTDEFNVYKCLFNNNGGLSTIKPTGTQVTPFVTADGYMWKFMYTIPTYLRNKFLSTTQMPVVNAIQNAYYSDGKLEKLVINAKGSRYYANQILAGTVSSDYVNGTINYRKLYGIGTKFLTATDTTQRLAAGNYIMVNNEVRKVGSVQSDTELTIDAADLQLYAEASTSITKINTYLEVTGDGYKEANPFIVTGVTVTNGGTGYGGTPKVTFGKLWTSSTALTLGQQVYYSNRLYTVTVAGTTSSSAAPTHTSGSAVNGTCTLAYAGRPAVGYITVGTTEGSPDRGTIISIDLTDAGTGYTSAPTVNIDAPFIATGTQATATALMSGTTVDFVSIDEAGSGYGSDSNITITFSDPVLAGQPAEATPVVSGGVVQSVVLNYCGYGYNTTPKAVVVDAGIPNPLNPTQIIKGDDATLEVNVVKSKAYIEPVINASTGEIYSGRITDGGIGYTYADITVRRLKVPPSGTYTNAAITANVNPGNLNTKQADVELAAINGGIHVIKVLNGGTGYTSATVTISGDGRGATATATVSNGAISKITVTNPGKEYTYATITITPVGSVPTVAATVKAIISPPNGHGKSAIDELFGRTILFFNRLTVEPIKSITVDSDYRQICLYRSPRVFGSQLLYNSFFGTTCYKLTLTVGSNPALSNIAINSVVNVQATTTSTMQIRFRVIGRSTSTILLQAIDNNDELVTAGYVMKSPTGYFYSIALVEKPDIDTFTGDMIYIDNRQPFKALTNQPVSVSSRFKL